MVTVPKSLPRRGAPILLSLLAALLAAGCGTPMDARDVAAFHAQASVADRPVVRPTRSISSFSPSLGCMDQMLRSAELPTTLITSKQIPDYSARVPVATKEMVITALSQMSRQSNAFRYVDYEVDIARQDTVQNLTMLLLNSNQVQLQRPALYLSGAISFVDQNVIANRFDVGASGHRLDAAYSNNRNATIIGLELHLGDFRTRTLIPGMDSANEVIVGTGGQGLDLAGRIGSYGVQFNVGRDFTQGAGAAVRTLVELATIELVGKWARLPYWQCLTLDQTHPHFQRQLRDWYGEGEGAVNLQLVKRSLAARGYLAAGADALPASQAGMREAIGRFQADSGIAVSGVVDFPTYERALRDFVALDANGTLGRIGWAPAERGVQGAAVPPLPALADAAPAGPVTVGLQIENLKTNRSFVPGEQVFISATVSRASFLSCYYANAQGAVMRLLPNNASRAMWVSANHAIRIPDWMSPNPGFIMDAGSPGVEGVACMATADDDPSRLPAAMGWPPLKAIPGYGSLEDVERAYLDSRGPAAYAVGIVRWQVDAGSNGAGK